jgi:hypothetical protein
MILERRGLSKVVKGEKGSQERRRRGDWSDFASVRLKD